MQIMNSCFSHFTENLIGWKRRRPRRRRARNRRRKARENTRKSTRAATAQVNPPVAPAAAVTVTQIQLVIASPRAKRKRKIRKKCPVGITALRANRESRVKQRPLLAGVGHRALTLDRSGLKRSLEIIDKGEQRGEGAGAAARGTGSLWRGVKKERGTAAGTGRDLTAPRMARTEVGAARGGPK